MAGQTKIGAAAGFTLFEMLVALALLSLLTVMLSGQIRFGLRAWETGAAVADELAEIQAVQMFLRHQLALTNQLRLEADEGAGDRRRRPIFAGEPRQLRLAVTGTPRFGPAPYGIIELAYRRNSGVGELHLDWRPHYPVANTSVTPEGRQRILLTGIRNVRFSYFGNDHPRDRDAPARWHDKWTDQPRLPRLIRIELDFDDGGRYWPELTVAPILR